MTFHKRSCVTVTCDICGESCDWPEELTVHFEDEHHALKELRVVHEWLHEDGQDFCEGCLFELDVWLDAIKALAHLGRST